MAVIIIPRSQFDFSGNGSSGGAASLPNSAVLSLLNVNSSGKLTFNGIVIGENSTETAFNIALNSQHVEQKFSPLPHDCDTSKIITLSLNGISFPQGTAWEVIEHEHPEQDLISWNGLELQNFAQSGDFVSISYYKKI